MKNKLVVAIALIAVLVGAGAAVYVSEASIYYRYDVHGYQKVGDQWYTVDSDGNRTMGTFAAVECQNRGLSIGSFHIMVRLINASFPGASFAASELIDNTTVKIPHSLSSLEKVSISVPFAVDANASGFVISIGLEPNQPLMHYTITNWLGQSQYPYYLGSNDTWWPAMMQ